MSFFAILPHILLPISMPLFLIFPPFPHRGIISATIIPILAYLALTSPFPSDTQLRYGLSQGWFWYIPTIAKLLIPYAHPGPETTVPGFKDSPELAYWHRGHVEEAVSMGFGWRKFRWATALWFNPRGVGWNYEGKDIAKLSAKRKVGKGRFLTERAVEFFLYYCLTDVVISYSKTFGFPEALENMGLVDKMKISLPAAAMIRGNWVFQWNYAAFLGVALGLSEPEDWPTFFGPISEVTSIAKFWGSFWQQVLHESVLTYSRWLIAFFGIPRHGTAAYTMHLCTGFFISGILHFITLSYTARYPSLGEKFAKIMFFFMMQPAGIFFEQWIKSVFKSEDTLAKPKREESKGHGIGDEVGSSTTRPYLGARSSRVLGYLWVVSFLFVTGWPFLDVYFQVGMADWDVPFSFVGWLMKISGYSR